MAAFDEAKLFVRNLPDEAGEQALSDYFAKYGEVVRSVVARDKSTGNPKGFGFVSFSTAESADRALQDGLQHVLLGRTVEIRKATRRPDQHQHRNSQSNGGTHKDNGYTSNNSSIDDDIPLNNKKVFVGGLPPTLTEEELKNYFEKYGNIVDVVVMYDNITQRPRGFGFVSFDSDEAAANVVQRTFHELQGKLVEAKKAIPKSGGNGEKRAYGYDYSARMSNGRGPSYGAYGPGMNSPHRASYGVYQNFYGPYPVYCYGDGGFPYGPAWYSNPYYVGPYGSVAYGGPMVPPRSPWNGYGMVGARRSPMPYNGPLVYAGYANGGVGVGGYMYSGAVAGSSDGKDQTGRNDQELQSGALHATSLMEDPHGSDELSSHSGQSGQDIRKR